MICLADVNENNFEALRRLDVAPEQRRFLDSPLGILARGYVYRTQRARVLAVLAEGEPVGLLLVKDMDEEPACYDLQQFMIDRPGRTMPPWRCSKGRALWTPAMWTRTCRTA